MKLLWQPSPERISKSLLTRFAKNLRQDFANFSELHAWSVKNLDHFWKEVLSFTELITEGQAKQAVDNPIKMPGARWFEDVKLNFAENLLRYALKTPEAPALLFFDETGAEKKLTFGELYNQVLSLSQHLEDWGVVAGDRVVGYVSNIPEAVIAMLATTKLGALWSSCSPDFGTKATLDRFQQIEPKVFFVNRGYFFKGKSFDVAEKAKAILKELPSVKKVVEIPYGTSATSLKSEKWENLLSTVPKNPFFKKFPFDHPLYIMYSSGTTGLPKCLVQGAGGILLNQIKEHVLHGNLSPGDRIFYYTTCGWMMWNWLVAALAQGATVILFDGNPFTPSPSFLWKKAEEWKFNILGTSAGYLHALQTTGYEPKRDFSLSALRTLLSTGSPLSEGGFEFVYKSIKNDLQLASISGGTDLNGCFALGNPWDPVYSGEIQGRGLGMDVQAWNEKGKPVTDEEGELVCASAFPAMPLRFWNDPDHTKYLSAYFSYFPGVWRHGDFIRISKKGTVRILGRSDATLNPGGVRIGTAEIYRQVEGMSEIEDSLVVGQDVNNDVRVILFIKLKNGAEWSEALGQKIRETIRKNATPRHIPAMIFPVPDIPVTLNLKKVELAVKNIIEGKSVTNRDSLKNPESLEHFKKLWREKAFKP